MEGWGVMGGVDKMLQGLLVLLRHAVATSWLHCTDTPSFNYR